MAKGWKCPRCSTNNEETAFNCSNCALIRGGVVVPGSYPSSQPSSDPNPIAPGIGVDRYGTAQPEGAAQRGEAARPDSLAPLETGPSDNDEPPSAWSATPPSKPIWQRLPWGWVLTFVIVGSGAIGGLIFNAGRSDSGEISKPGDLTVLDLRVGDCFDLKDATATEVEQVTAQPCSVEHEYEMFFVGAAPAGPYPGTDAFLSFVDENCIAGFETYVGTAYANSQLDVFWLEPTESAWTAGDRTVQCAVYHPAKQRLTGSLKGSNQ